MRVYGTGKSEHKRIVVLGGLGFLGSHICHALVAEGHRVRILDRPQASPEGLQEILSRVEIVRADIAETERTLSAIEDAHTVVHLVHTTVPSSSMLNPAFDVTSNVVATVGWLQRLNETNVQHVIYCSSGGTVYGIAKYNPIDEDHPTNPISSYGISKLTIEKYVAMYADLYGIDYVIMRPSNVFGEGHKTHHNQGVIGVMIERALRGQPFEIWGDGHAMRDYLYVEDLASAVQALVDYSGDQHVFNVSTDVGHSLSDVVSLVRDALGSSFDIVQKPVEGFHVPSSILDSSRLRSATGWQSRITLNEGVARTVEWFRKSMT